MPEWRIHRKWARRLGIPDEISRDVDELIDFPKRWISKNGLPDDLLDEEIKYLMNLGLFNDNSLFTHDWGRKRKWETDILLELVSRIYGEQGVKSAILHHALDYMKEVQYMPKEEILTRIENRLRSQGCLKGLFEVLRFIDENFEEIQRDIGPVSPEKISSQLSFAQRNIERRNIEKYPSKSSFENSYEPRSKHPPRQTRRDRRITFKYGDTIIDIKFIKENWTDIIAGKLRFVYATNTNYWMSKDDEKRFVDWWTKLLASKIKHKSENTVTYREWLISVSPVAKELWEIIFSLGIDSQYFTTYLGKVYNSHKHTLNRLDSKMSFDKYLQSVKEYIKDFWNLGIIG